MDLQAHYRFLERMYEQAPVVRSAFPGSRIQVGSDFARIQWEIEEKYHHAAGSLHGSAYFRLLDDAAYFAASSRETSWFLLTTSFEIQFLRPVSEGLLRAEGRLLEESAKQLLFAEAELFNPQGKIVAKGKGKFARSRKALSSTTTFTS